MTAPDSESLPDRRRAAKRFWIPLALTIMAGAALRFMFPGDAPFGADEAFALVLGGDWLQNPRLAFHGMPASVGLDNPPATVYFFAAIHAVSGGDPLRATLAVVAWNVFGLILAGLYLGRRTARLGPFWAWWALALLCFNPWAVLFSRKIWAQDLLLPLVVASLWCFDAIWSRRWNWRRIGAGIFFAVVVSQIHMSGMIWLAALAPVFILLWPKEEKRRLPGFLLLGAGLALALYAPYLVYLLQNGIGTWPSAEGISLYERGMFGFYSLFSVWTGLGQSLDFFFGPGEPRFGETMGEIWNVGQWSALLPMSVAVAGAVVEFFRALAERFDSKQRSAAEAQGENAANEARAGDAEGGLKPALRTGQAEACALNASTGALVLFLVAIAILGIPVYPHYGAVLLFPAAAALALGLNAIEKRWGRDAAPAASSRNQRRHAARVASRAAACLVLALHLWTTLGFFARVHRQGGTLGDYGPTLRFKTREVARMVRDGQQTLSESAPLEYHYLLDRITGRRTRLEDHPRPY